MSETYPRKNLCETLFAGHTPSSVGIGCKDTTKFADVQILGGKSFKGKWRKAGYRLEIRGWNIK